MRDLQAKQPVPTQAQLFGRGQAIAGINFAQVTANFQQDGGALQVRVDPSTAATAQFFNFFNTCKDNRWDNAYSETLLGSLKVEQLHGQYFETHRQAKDTVLPWLFWYNQKRLHSTL